MKVRNLLLAAVVGLALSAACAVPSASLPNQETPAPAPESAQPPEATAPPAEAETPVTIPRGTLEEDIYVPVYKPGAVCHGTTLFADNHDLAHPRIIEVNMLGEVIWEYPVPQNLRQFTNPGFDAEPLPDGNILFVLPRRGVYEVNRQGEVIWSYLDQKVSHDADRLPNGNTLVVFGGGDTVNDAQAKEVNPDGQIVWAWYAGNHFNKSPYKEISNEGWTHTNAAVRLPDGNTLISLRNFNFIVEVDPQGTVVRTIGDGVLRFQHDPETLPNCNILVADHSEPQRAIELDPDTGQIVWQFIVPRQLVRDADRLPNGNTLITGATTLLEVTAEGEIVWQLKLKDLILERQEAPARGFYKAERIVIDE